MPLQGLMAFCSTYNSCTSHVQSIYVNLRGAREVNAGGEGERGRADSPFSRHWHQPSCSAWCHGSPRSLHAMCPTYADERRQDQMQRDGRPKQHAVGAAGHSEPARDRGQRPRCRSACPAAAGRASRRCPTRSGRCRRPAPRWPPGRRAPRPAAARPTRAGARSSARPVATSAMAATTSAARFARPRSGYGPRSKVSLSILPVNLKGES